MDNEQPFGKAATERLQAQMPTVTREDLAKVLEDWRDERVSMPTVHLWAEERYGSRYFEPADDVVNEILDILDRLHIEELSTDDAAVLTEILHQAGTDVEQARTAWAAHLQRR